MRWIRVHNLPEYAYFAHDAHAAAGIGCVTCHGRVDEMETVTADDPAQHGLVPRLPPRSGAAPASRLGSHQHAVDAPPRPRAARRAAGPRTAGRSAHRLLGVPPVKTYWRSLEQIEDRPAYREALEREFPEGASELPAGMTRRNMMQLLGASLSLAGLAGCRRPVEEIVPYVNAPEDIVPGVPRLLRDDDAVSAERVRARRGEPRGAADQDRGEPGAPVDARRVELAHPGVGARALRSGPVAVDHAQGGVEDLGRVRRGLGAAGGGPRGGRRRGPRRPHRVVRLANAGAAVVGASRAVSADAVGHLGRRERRAPARGSEGGRRA